MKQTNYLNFDRFYEFEDWLVRLESFHSDEIVPPMTANEFYWMARTQLSIAGRITEVIELKPKCFDFDHRIVTIVNPKSNKGGVQKTTIFPFDVKPMEKFVGKYSENEQMFKVTRSTAWKYYKNASILGGMNIFEAKDEKTIENAWTHLLRSSCAKIMKELHAEDNIVARKLRHSPRSVTQVYTKVDLNTLLEWEEQNLSVCPMKPSNDRTYEVCVA